MSGQHVPALSCGPLQQEQPAIEMVGAFLQAGCVSEHDARLEAKIAVGPCGGLFQVGQGPVPDQELDIALRLPR